MLRTTQITVKCDIPTFAWLMAYVKAAGVSGQQQPETTPNNCLQLLLASHYLQVKDSLPCVSRAVVGSLTACLCSSMHQRYFLQHFLQHNQTPWPRLVSHKLPSQV